MNNLEKNNPVMPNIKRYVHILTFLKDYYAYRKAQDSQFSHDLWSTELNFKSSSYMYLIASGRRTITMKFIDQFSLVMRLSTSEKNHLILLASYSKTKSPSLKEILFNKILENLEGNENTIEAKNYFKFISSATMPVIIVALGFDDVKGSEKELGQILNLSSTKVKKDLTALEKMGLIKKSFRESSSEAFWKPVAKDLVIPDDRSNSIMDSFHHSTAIEATEILKQTDIFKRFRSVLFTINPQEHQLLISEMESFLTKMKNKFRHHEMTGRHVIKVNLQAYPVSQIKE